MLRDQEERDKEAEAAKEACAEHNASLTGRAENRRRDRTRRPAGFQLPFARSRAQRRHPATLSKTVSDNTEHPDKWNGSRAFKQKKKKAEGQV